MSSNESLLARRQHKRIKAYHALQAHLSPLRQRAYNECFLNKWPYTSIDASCVGWNGEVWWGSWYWRGETFEPTPPTEYTPEAQAWFTMQAEGEAALAHWRRIKALT